MWASTFSLIICLQGKSYIAKMISKN